MNPLNLLVALLLPVTHGSVAEQTALTPVDWADYAYTLNEGESTRSFVVRTTAKAANQSAKGRIALNVQDESNYYAIDGNKWPPKALIRVPTEKAVVLITLGICIRPMPKAEMYADEASEIRRIEFAMALPAEFPDDEVQKLASFMSSLSNIPWEDLTWLGEGHTVGCAMIPPGQSQGQAIHPVPDLCIARSRETRNEASRAFRHSGHRR